MKYAAFDYILKTITETNILPVTSSCVTGCIFCSHGNNPEGVEVYRLPQLTFNDICEMAQYLDGSRKIIIGESASRIIEGEPFIRNDMMDILKMLRKKYPETLIEITTNGYYLSFEIIAEIKKLEPVEINISLNSAADECREKLYRGGSFINAVDAVVKLKDSGVNFNGSIVAMPDVVGFKDIENTISYLGCAGAQTVRVFVPGFSKLAKYNIDFFGIRDRLHSIADDAYDKYNVPVLIEPPVIESLDAEICGVIRESAAMMCGLKKGDIIVSVNGVVPFSRVDAYNLLYKYKDPEVSAIRKGTEVKCILRKKAQTSSGAVFYYDINPDVVSEISKAINRNRAKHPVVVTSELGYHIIEMAFKKASVYGVNILAVKNLFFGGTIMCAGLLTAGDIIENIRIYSQEYNIDLIIAPAISFDTAGKDIRGSYYYEIEENLSIKTVIV